MAQYVLTIKGTVIPRRTLHQLRPDKLSSSNITEGKKRWLFDKAIHNKLGNSYSFAPPRPDNNLVANYEDALSEDKIPPEIPFIITGEEATPDIPEGDVVNAAYGTQMHELI